MIRQNSLSGGVDVPPSSIQTTRTEVNSALSVLLQNRPPGVASISRKNNTNSLFCLPSCLICGGTAWNITFSGPANSHFDWRVKSGGPAAAAGLGGRHSRDASRASGNRCRGSSTLGPLPPLRRWCLHAGGRIVTRIWCRRHHSVVFRKWYL